MHEDLFQLTKGFTSYVSKPEITDLAPTFLVKGSKNVLIDYAKRVVSRNGYSLYGAANNGGGGVKSSYEWATSTAKEFPVRCYDGRVEFYWNSAWNLLKSGLATSVMEFTKVWDNTEKIDVLMFVLGDTNTRKWSGGVSKLWKSTATTLTKQGVLTAKTTIAFVAGDGSTVNATITDSDSNFLNAGFVAGDTLYVTGSTANSRNFTIASVTAGTISLIMSDTLTAEGVGPAITLHNGEPTWATSRFLTTGTRAVIYGGVSYTYTGGETSDTLTGLSGFPAVAVGDATWQDINVLANPGAIPSYFKQDLCATQLNALILGSTKSQEIYGSLITDYTNFTIPSPRAPGDPFKVTMDNFATCIVPHESLDATVSNLLYGGGRNEFFKMDYKMSQDNSQELVRMIKLRAAASSGVISKGAITPIKDGAAYITREPTLEIIGNISNAGDDQKIPYSDPVKDDFDGYDFTNCHVRYWKRAIYIALPQHGLVLIYDLIRKLWQPPQTIPVSRLAVIGDWLYGHSSVTNETYKLFDGTNDNGVVINQVARFAYNNGGHRDRVKNLSEYWSDGYITPGAELDLNLFYGYKGNDGTRSVTILGSDTEIVTQGDANPLGSDQLGAEPLGGAGFGLDPVSAMSRFWQVDTCALLDYTEVDAEYTLNTLDAQFALVAHGPNAWDAGTSPVRHKK